MDDIMSRPCQLCGMPMRAHKPRGALACPPAGTITDGFGSYWHKCQPVEKCEMHVVRPGYAACYKCEEEQRASASGESVHTNVSTKGE